MAPDARRVEAGKLRRSRRRGRRGDGRARRGGRDAGDERRGRSDARRRGDDGRSLGRPRGRSDRVGPNAHRQRRGPPLAHARRPAPLLLAVLGRPHPRTAGRLQAPHALRPRPRRNRLRRVAPVRPPGAKLRPQGDARAAHGQVRLRDARGNHRDVSGGGDDATRSRGGEAATRVVIRRREKGKKEEISEGRVRVPPRRVHGRAPLPRGGAAQAGSGGQARPRQPGVVVRQVAVAVRRPAAPVASGGDLRRRTLRAGARALRTRRAHHRRPRRRGEGGQGVGARGGRPVRGAGSRRGQDRIERRGRRRTRLAIPSTRSSTRWGRSFRRSER